MNYSWFVRGQKHSALCQVSMQAVKKMSPGAKLIVSTDDRSLTIPGAEMVYFPSGLPLMVANLEAHLAVLDRVKEFVVFLDTDVLFQKPFPFIGGEVVVTHRDTVGGVLEDVPGGVQDTMPYNFGVLGVASSLRGIESWLWMRERIRKMSSHLQDWWGNQLALAALCGPRPETDMVLESRRIPWQMSNPGPEVLIGKIPGNIWNYTPRSEDEDLSEKGAIHFKGHTRPWMKPCAERMGLTWVEKTDD